MHALLRFSGWHVHNYPPPRFSAAAARDNRAPPIVVSTPSIVFALWQIQFLPPRRYP